MSNRDYCSHHWSYNEIHLKDTIHLQFSFHIMYHKYLLYDIDYKQYRTLTGRLLNTKLKHLSHIVFIKKLMILELYNVNKHNIKHRNTHIFGVPNKMPKKIITLQLDPMTIARIWQWGKDEGLPKQVAIQQLIKYGFDHLESIKSKRKK